VIGAGLGWAAPYDKPERSNSLALEPGDVRVNEVEKKLPIADALRQSSREPDENPSPWRSVVRKRGEAVDLSIDSKNEVDLVWPGTGSPSAASGIQRRDVAVEGFALLPLLGQIVLQPLDGVTARRCSARGLAPVNRQLAWWLTSRAPRQLGAFPA
jgi:hypothetical protein